MAGSGLLLSAVSREDEGLYLCTASNGVGAPASASVRLTVLCKLEMRPAGQAKTAVGITVTLYSPSLLSAGCSVYIWCLDPPEIELETNRVHSGIDKEAHLTCRVQGNPEPTVSNSQLTELTLQLTAPLCAGFLVQRQQPSLTVRVSEFPHRGESPHSDPQVCGKSNNSTHQSPCFSVVFTLGLTSETIPVWLKILSEHSSM